MRYRFEASIPWPLPAVAEVMQHRIERLASYLHGVASVHPLPAPVGTTRHRWLLERAAFPAAVGPLLPDEALGFEDALTWDGPRAQFAVTPLQHADAVAFSGALQLHEDGYDTLVAVEGDFRLTPAAIQRLPDVLRGRGVDAMEAAVVSSVRAHLTMACRAVDQLLDDET